MRANVRLVGISFFAIALIGGTAYVLAIPPWNHRGLQKFHLEFARLTGISIHRFPNHYTGRMTFWGEGEAREVRNYQNGQRHGVWRTYRSDGTLENQCEYRHGRPWNGVCQIFEFKAFVADYENGLRIPAKKGESMMKE